MVNNINKLLRASIVLFILIISSTIRSFSQENLVTEVKLDFTHSLRIYDYHVTVDFQRLQDSVHVHVTSVPMHNSSQFNKTKRNYSFKISTTDFEKLIASL